KNTAGAAKNTAGRPEWDARRAVGPRTPHTQSALLGNRVCAGKPARGKTRARFERRRGPAPKKAGRRLGLETRARPQRELPAHSGGNANGRGALSVIGAMGVIGVIGVIGAICAIGGRGALCHGGRPPRLRNPRDDSNGSLKKPPVVC